jgi:hypothetical protein
MHPKSSFILQFSSPRNFEGTVTSHLHEVHVGTESESIACVRLRQSVDRLHMWAGHGISESNDCRTEKLHVGALPKGEDKWSKIPQHEITNLQVDKRIKKETGRGFICGTGIKFCNPWRPVQEVLKIRSHFTELYIEKWKHLYFHSWKLEN